MARRSLAMTQAPLWSLTWGLGVAIGVALGGWLTVVGGAGAPGTESLDVTQDLLLLPGICGAIVFAAHFAGQGLVGLVRARRTSRDRRQSDQEGEQAEENSVNRQIGSEIEPSDD